MMGPLEPIELIGKMVKDQYGRQMGMIVSVLMDNRGDMSWVLVKMGDGRFRRFRLSDVVIDGSEVITYSSLKRRVEALRRKAALLRREGSLLIGLRERMGERALEEMGKDIEDSVEALQAEASYLLRRVKDALEAVSRQLRDVRRGLACLEVEHELGKLPDEAFELFRRILMNGLKTLLAERNDLEEALSMLKRFLEEHTSVKEGHDGAEDEPIDVEVGGTTDVVGA